MDKLKSSLLILVICLLQLEDVSAFDFYKDFYQNEQLVKQKNTSNFPYKSYLESYTISNIDTLIAHKQGLDKKGWNGDDVLFSLCEIYLEQYPFNPRQVSSCQNLVNLGERLYVRSQNAPDSLQKTYFIMADIILQSLASSLERCISERKISKNEPIIQKTIQVLATCDYQVNITENDREKITKHVFSGNWSYLWKKFNSRCMLDCLQGGKCSKICWCVGIIPLVLLIGLFFWYKKTFIKKKNVH